MTARRVIAAGASAAALATVTAIALPGGTATARPAAATAPASPAAAAARPANRPNILFILVDDMGFSDLSIMGNKKVQTPNIDRLAGEGLLMTRFYDSSPVCSPSRAGLFTGVYPARNRFVIFLGGRQHNERVGQAEFLDPKLPNYARALHDAGYATAHFGKWHLGSRGAPPATAYGYDETFTTVGGGEPTSGPKPKFPKSAGTALFIDKTLDFVGRHKGQPWLVDLWFNDVHLPWTPNQEQLQLAKGRGANPDENRFFGMLVAMDQQIGRLEAQLRAMGELDNTLIVMTSDNGPTSHADLYQKDGVPAGSALPLRGRKNSLYEGGTRQPMIVRWPGHVPAGRRDETTVVSGVDFYPTLAALTGIKAPPKPDGISVLSAWQGKPIASRPDLYWTYGASGPYNAWTRPGLKSDTTPGYSIRSGPWKLLAEGDGSKAELYNEESDPTEKTNVIAQQPAIAKAMTAKLVAWAKSLPIPPSFAPYAPPVKGKKGEVEE